ncbi:tetratricopeptide repeat protein [Sphingomonas cavernae]|uniref:TolA-binding protein n=1 Tax=Sphingomonas cavernae TaxID=2320861 RepID=A0A418WRT4_9SPHN|nr:tetratricopeptide repeat protein [Sphingomonas cavernae]RJF93931.1 hypothetical protein D3876_06570 [Sphingomonas cavernae]
MRRTLFLAILLGGIAAQPLAAQSGANLTPRVDKLEKEMKAVQRKVFPGGAPGYFEPEIAAPAQVVDPAGAPASTPLADLTSRVSALETELRTLTEQSEQNAFRVRQLEEAMTKYKAEVDGRLTALEGGAAPATPPAAASGSVKPPVARPTAATPALSTERAAALDAIQKPATGDAGEDAYLYGYRLWEAKFYPQAQAQLKAFVEKYPKHKRVSYANNLLGRAYLDEGKPALASVAFYDNYQKLPKGERAPESLYYLGVSLTRLKKTADACKVYEEFDQVYGATASAGLKAQVAKGRAEAKCKA